MKKQWIIILCLPLLLGACAKYAEEKPTACMMMQIISGKDDAGRDIYTETSSAEVGQSVYFGHCSDADKFAIYPGDLGHVYGEEHALGYNLNFIDNAFVNYAYDSIGTFTVTMVATNTSSGSPDVTFTRDVLTATITISAASK